MEYAQKSRYNASQVPAEWHGWLHHVTDRTGDEVSTLKVQLIVFKDWILISVLFFNMIIFVAIDAKTQKVWG